MSIAAAIILAAVSPAVADAPKPSASQTQQMSSARASVTVRRAERIDFSDLKTSNPEKARVSRQENGDVYLDYR